MSSIATSPPAGEYKAALDQARLDYAEAKERQARLDAEIDALNLEIRRLRALICSLANLLDEPHGLTKEQLEEGRPRRGRNRL